MILANWSSEVMPFLGAMQGWLHAKTQHRLSVLLLGALFAQGRQTVASWLRAACVGREFRLYYYFLGSIGHRIDWCALSLLHLLLDKVHPGKRLVFALDDSPTKRYGPCVEGAGIHHNPTPGPAGQDFLYGHVFVTLALVAVHPLWGTLALPLLARLYVRRRDVPLLKTLYDWTFRTKLELASELLVWLAQRLRGLGKTVWVVVDGFYAKREFLRTAKEQGMVVVFRLRKDAALYSVPEPVARRGRGRPRIYDKQKLSLCKRAGHRCGWQTVTVHQYCKDREKTVKSFVATWKPAQGAIRVVLVKEEGKWLAFGCMDVEASPESILEAASERTSIEQTFADVKEVHGAGKQQVRHVWASLASWHVMLWMYSLVEWWSWDKRERQLCDRRDSPWDDPDRRPSHRDKRKALRQACLKGELTHGRLRGMGKQKIRQVIQYLVNCAA